MSNWTNRRKASLAFHAVVVLIPLIFGTISALLFWQSLFQSWLVAVPMVAVIDALALAGLVLFICKIESPFARLRHALPFVSIVPLGIELWRLLTPHNVLWVVATITILATAIMVGVAWRCYVTIERLFIDPVAAAAEQMQEQALAARQRMTQQVEALTVTLSALTDMQAMAVSAVQEWGQRPQLTIISADSTMPALTDTALTAAVSRRQVRAYADRLGVSDRTIWRRLERGELSAADILGKEAS